MSRWNTMLDMLLGSLGAAAACLLLWLDRGGIR